MSPVNQEKTIRDYITDVGSSDRHKLKVCINIFSYWFLMSLPHTTYKTTITAFRLVILIKNLKQFIIKLIV